MTQWQRLSAYLRTCSRIEWEVWDRPTRFFHWSITGVLTATLITGWLDPAWQLDRHLLLGSMAIGLLFFRLVWGVAGSEYSRFSHYFFAPSQFLNDFKDLWLGRPKNRSLGLNPASAWVSLALLLILAGLVVTGFMAYGGEEHQGPLAALVSYSDGEQARLIHGWLAVLIIFLVAVHVWIIRRESQLTRVSLVRSMLTGCKPMDMDYSDEHLRKANSALAAVAGIVLMFAVDHSSKILGQLPLDGWRPIQYPPAYREKCGQCHWSIHPSLFPEEAWQDLLSRLDHHFGTKVSLTGKEAVTVTSFLMVHAAEDWNTDAAHLIRKSSSGPFQRLTSQPTWLKIHASINPAIFNNPPVSSPVNCPICHHDASSGRFDEHAIHTPAGPAL